MLHTQLCGYIEYLWYYVQPNHICANIQCIYILLLVQHRLNMKWYLSDNDLSDSNFTSESFVWNPVHNSTNGNHLAWEEEGCVENFSLNDDKTSITVKEPGVYLVYVQLTYSLKKDGNSSNIHLNLTVEFTYTEDKVEFNGAFDNRQLTEKEQDAHLTAFFLLKMTAGNKLSIIAYPKNRIKYDDVRPFSSYITIVRYADLSGWEGKKLSASVQTYALCLCQLFSFLLFKSQNWSSSVMMSKRWPVASEAFMKLNREMLKPQEEIWQLNKFGLFV